MYKVKLRSLEFSAGRKDPSLSDLYVSDATKSWISPVCGIVTTSER